MLEIRPHHLLCTAGYRGINYNPESADNWAKIINNLKTNPNVNFRMVMGEDSLCLSCKHSQKNGGSCDKNFVKQLDDKVKNLLGIEEGLSYSFKNIQEKLLKIINFQKHETICKDCGWWKKGLCHDTFEKI